MVSVNNFGISFGDTLILEDINFDVNNGEIVTLLGQSGCGKTTILRSIAGLQREHEGDICIGDTCVSSKDVFQKDREVGYIFQDYALFPHLNVEENIAFALDSLSKKEKEKRIVELLEQFDIVSHRHKSIHQLSGGQQQRVAIARAMANNPKVLLLDEPFANLDSILRYKTKMWLKNLIKENNLSAVLVTHDKKEALSISDKIGIINDKKLVQFDTTTNIYNNPKNYYVANFLSEINILNANVIKKLNVEIKSDEIASIKVDDTILSNNQNNLELKLIDSSFCGDFYEVIVCFKDDESSQLHVKLKDVKVLLEAFYLNINLDDIKIIKS
ncbi:MAG: ABC transporter ATP-binding protein [Sulfurovum sp.]|jgi:iron(III) transport system ATP-binding protein|nr:MAG: Fe(3+) ions import ATP-binding protein FbpC 2 [Arcobacter lacus]